MDPRARLQQLAALTDDQLRESARQAFRSEAAAKLDVLYHLVEVERRRLHLRDGFSSLFAYATDGLGYPRGAAARRIACARAIGKFPAVHDALLDGRLTMSGIAILAPVLDDSNVEEVVARAAGRSQDDLAAVAASYRPEPPVRERIEPIAVATTGVESSGPDEVEARFRVVFSMDAEMREKFEQVRSLLSGRAARSSKEGKFPRPGEAKIEVIFGVLLEEYLERHCPERRQRKREAKRARAKDNVEDQALGTPARAQVHPEIETDPEFKIDESTSPTWCPRRFLEVELRDAVWARDGGRCTYVSPDGRRCNSTWNLEIDHRVPFARRPVKPRLEELRLLCRPHNLEEARRVFGSDRIDRAIRERRRRSRSDGSSSASGSDEGEGTGGRS